MVAISTGDSAAEVGRFRRETGMTYPVLLDEGRIASAYRITASPTFVWIDAGGAIRYRGSHLPEELR